MLHFLVFGFLFIGIIQALGYADFGLPNQNPCVFSHGGKVYIINQQSLAISFHQPWDNTSPQIISHNLTTVGACSITRSGRVIFLPLDQQQTLQVIDDITLPWILNSNITYLGSQNAIDLFIKRTIPLTRLVTTAFNDFIMILGANNESSTFILDTRYLLYTWHEISFSTNSPTPSSVSTLYATSRWILYFHIDLNTILVHCFDPLTFQWYGLISTLEIKNSNNQTQLSIQVIPTAVDPDSFLIITRQEDETSATTNMWQSNTSTLTPEITVLFLNPIVQQSASSSGSGSVMVTRIDDEMALFYGGKENLEFLNTSNKAFIETPLWLAIAGESTHDNNSHLGIILGTVLGGVVFIIVLVVLFIWLRKRSNVSLRPNNSKARGPLMNERNIERSPSISQFTLSPIKRLSPINLFPLPCDHVSSSEDEGITVLPQPKIKSRFKEHFHYDDSIASESLQQDSN